MADIFIAFCDYSSWKPFALKPYVEHYLNTCMSLVLYLLLVKFRSWEVTS